MPSHLPLHKGGGATSKLQLDKLQFVGAIINRPSVFAEILRDIRECPLQYKIVIV